MVAIAFRPPYLRQIRRERRRARAPWVRSWCGWGLRHCSGQPQALVLTRQKRMSLPRTLRASVVKVPNGDWCFAIARVCEVWPFTDAAVARLTRRRSASTPTPMLRRTDLPSTQLGMRKRKTEWR